MLSLFGRILLRFALIKSLHRFSTGHSAENLAVARRMAMNLLKQDKSRKTGAKNKRLEAAWNADHLAKLLASS